MLQMNANDRTEIKEARAGDIVALCGLKDTTTGETLCFKESAVILEKVRVWVLCVGVGVAHARNHNPPHPPNTHTHTHTHRWSSRSR